MGFGKIILVTISIGLLISFFGHSDQSRRVVTAEPKPSAPTPTPVPQSPTAPHARNNLLLEDSTERYRLIFSPDAQPSSFIDLLNKSGQAGYRLKSVVYGWLPFSGKYYTHPMGILEIDEARYEYAWFETTTYFFYGSDGFEAKYAQLAKHGFHLVNHFYIGGSCEYLDPDNLASGQRCEISHGFLVERVKGVEGPREFIVAGSAPTRRGVPVVELATEINQKITDGFYPTDLISRAQILLEPIENDELSNEKLELQLVTSSLKENVNKFAKQGFRLALLNDEAAVMYRQGKSAPLEYVWLKAKSRGFEQRLEALGGSGAVYRMIDKERFTGNSLVFEKSTTSEGNQREYRVLKFGFGATRNVATGPKSPRTDEVRIDLTSASKVTLKLLNGLAREGFRVRELFVSDSVSDKVSLLLERSR